MFLKKFVEDLAIVDSEENKQRLIIEAINDDDIINTNESVVMDIFNGKTPELKERVIDKDFENILVNTEIPDEIPAERKCDYITRLIDESMGIEHDDEYSIEAPIMEEAGDVEKDENNPKVLTMKSSDKDALIQIINTYNEDKMNSPQNKNAVKRFALAVFNHIKNPNNEVSSSVTTCVGMLHDKLINPQNGSNTSADAKKENNNTKQNNTPVNIGGGLNKGKDKNAELRQQLQDIISKLR